jgi:hypothetical protein
MPTKVDDLTREEWRPICRIVDASGDGLFVGTVVLVSDQGREFGYALTCWHNFDETFEMEIKGQETLESVFLMPSSDKVDDQTHRSPVTVVGLWSNKVQDFAVLKVPRVVIDGFRLRPMAVSRDLRKGMRLSVMGFQRPGTLLDPDRVEVSVTGLDKEIDGSTRHAMRVFEVTSNVVPFDKGMSGGAMFNRAHGALMGLAAAVRPDDDAVDKHVGYGIPIASVMQTWTLMADHCRVVGIPRVKPLVAGVLSMALVLGAAAALYVTNRPLDWQGAGQPGPAEGSPVTGKPVAATRAFRVQEGYAPSGIMGDVGDVTIGSGDDGADRFTYVATGRPDHEWDQKYVNGELNRRPAKFGGVMYLSPANDWGQSPDAGYDLRGFRRLVWDARSVNGEARVEFVLGGVNWIWTTREGKWEKAAPPYPDTMPALRLGTMKLTGEWQTFERELADQPEQSFRRVVGGFGWVMSWGANGVEPNDEGTRAREPRTFVIEFRNVRYER